MPIRILIVDDSVVIRRSLTAALSDGPGLTVVGSAATGHIALMKMPLLRPDLVLLALEMAGDDGLETLAAIRSRYPLTGVILLHSASSRGAAVVGKALALGCLGCVSRPDAAPFSGAGVERLVSEVVSIVASSALVGVDTRQEGIEPFRQSSAQRVDVVAIGVSTGGPAALMELLPDLAGDFPVPIVLVQHMPPAFTRLLAERLDAKCRVRVAEGAAHAVLSPGEALIAPGGYHMTVERHGPAVRIATSQGSRENSCRPSVDVLFRSVARAFGAHALAVVMTGMGRDGVAGCQEIRAAGGQVIVQDESSSVVWGMPGLVVKADLADQIVPLNRLAGAITERVKASRVVGDLVGR